MDCRLFTSSLLRADKVGVYPGPTHLSLPFSGLFSDLVSNDSSHSSSTTVLVLAFSHKLTAPPLASSYTRTMRFPFASPIFSGNNVSKREASFSSFVFLRRRPTSPCYYAMPKRATIEHGLAPMPSNRYERVRVRMTVHWSVPQWQACCRTPRELSPSGSAPTLFSTCSA